MNKPDQLRNFQILMVFGVASMIMNFYFLEFPNKTLTAIFVSIFCICNLTGFPLLIEKISKRVGHEYIVLGTGMIFYVSQLSTALVSYLVGIFLKI